MVKNHDIVDIVEQLEEVCGCEIVMEDDWKRVTDSVKSVKIKEGTGMIVVIEQYCWQVKALYEFFVSLVQE